MKITQEEIDDVRDFVESLNAQKGSAVLVEGQRDAAALRGLGFTGVVLKFHSFGGPVRFAESASGYDRIIMLLDGDRSGRAITSRIITLMQSRARLDLTFKKRLIRATRGRIRFVEELSMYGSYGQMPR